jgi:hypothetical protein
MRMSITSRIVQFYYVTVAKDTSVTVTSDLISHKYIG